MISITPAIKTLKIRNLGIIRKTDMEFTKGINIVYGSCATGKTTVLNAIKHSLTGEKLRYGPSRDKKRSEKAVIEIELLRKKMSMEVKEQRSVYEECLRTGILPTGQRIYDIESPERIRNMLSAGERTYIELFEAIRMSNKGQAILLDGTFDYLDREHRKIAFSLLKKSKLQVIMTARCEDELVKDANIIKLKMIKGFYHGT